MHGPVRMTRSRPRGPAALLAAAIIVLLIWAPSEALADTTVIGEQNLTPNMATIDQIGQNIPVFQGDAGAGYVLSSPRAGTITSWRFLSGGVAQGKQFELAVLAPTDQTGTTWRLMATSSPVAVTTADGTDAVNGPFPVQIPIDVGERIALMPVDDSNTPIETGTQNVDGIRFFAASFPALGSSQDIVSSADSGQVVPIQATVTFTGQPIVPVNTKLPSISGTARQFETLTGDSGLWQNGVNSFALQWLRCAADGNGCAALPGATSGTYTVTRDDIGFTLRFQVIASNDGGPSPPVLSAPTAVVQRGVITAKLTLGPNPTCTGIPTTFNGAGSVSPDGIKSYSFSLIDLYAAAQHNIEQNGGSIDGESVARLGVAFEASLLEQGGAEAQFLINNFDGRPTVTNAPTVTETLDWNRDAIFNPDDALPTPPIGALARDDVGVLLIVTDYAGASAEAVGVLNFAQRLSSDSRAKCPKLRRILVAPNAVLAAALIFAKGSTQPSAKANCATRIACVGSITVVARGTGHAADAARRVPRVLATAFFKIPPHARRRISLKLTPLGKQLLHPGARVPVTVTISSVSATGRSVKHSYSQVLRR